MRTFVDFTLYSQGFLSDNDVRTNKVFHQFKKINPIPGPGKVLETPALTGYDEIVICQQEWHVYTYIGSGNFSSYKYFPQLFTVQISTMYILR